MASGRVLVTGLAGFTGTLLCDALESRGYEVVGLDASVPAEWAGRIRACDLLDRAGLRSAIENVQPDAVLHLAGISSVTHEDKSQIYQVNIIGTRNLLEACAGLSAGPRAIVLASTANIYGNTGGAALDETTPPAPTNDYAVSKLAMEYMAGMFKDKLPITIARPFNYTGRGQTERFVVPKIVNHFKAKAPVLELGNLDVTREFSDVRRVVEAYARLLDEPRPRQVFNICSGAGVTLRQILSHCERLSGHSLRVEVNPAFVRENEVDVLVGSCAKLESAVGSLPSYSIEETLSWMLE